MPDKSLTLGEVLDHIKDMKSMPHQDIEGVHTILSGYGRRAINDQVMLKANKVKASGMKVSPELETALREAAEREINPQIEQIKTALGTVPYDVLKNVFPVVLSQIAHPSNLAGQFGRKNDVNNHNYAVSVMVGGNGERGHKFDPGESMIHELAHANDNSKTSLSGESTVDTSIDYMSRVLGMYINKNPMSINEQYKQDPSEAYANFMMEKYKSGELNADNFHGVAKEAAKRARLLEMFYQSPGI